MAIREDNKEILMTYDALKSRGLPTSNLERNAATLKFIQTDICEPGEGIYKPSTNTIFYGIYDKDVILHELIHVASSDCSNEKLYIRGRKYHKSSGFTLINDNADKIGVSICEGLTEYYRMLFHYNGSTNKNLFSCENYYYASIISRLLLELIGEDTVGNLFFDNKLMEFFNLVGATFNDKDGLIISLSDDIFELNSDSLLSNFLFKCEKMKLTNMLLKLSYKNILDKDLYQIFKNHIDLYFQDEAMNSLVATKKLERAKNKYYR